MAVTTDEAASLGLLPHEVKYIAPTGQAIPSSARRELIREGAVETPTGLRLLLPSQTASDIAVRRLAASDKRNRWIVVGTVWPDGDDD